MELSLSADQKALIDSLEPLLERHKELPQKDRKGRYYYDRALDRALEEAGYHEIVKTEGYGPLEAALVVDAISSLPCVVECATTILVAPQVLPADIPRPFSVIHGSLARPQRFLPIAKTALFDTGDDLVVIEVDQANVENLEESIFAYPFGKFRQAPNLSAAQRLGREAAETFRQWSRVAMAVECGAAMLSATTFTVDYVKQRHIFNRPLGSYQAVQHRLAACHQLARGARLLALKAAWSGDPADAAMAAAYAQQHIDKLRFDLHQFNGGMGMSHEHLLHFWTYRMRALESEFGGPGRSAVAAAQLAFAS